MNQLYVVGIGPGCEKQMTQQAVQVLSECDVIAGYTVYVDLIRNQFPDKEFLVTPMKQEEKRCELALEKAGQGYRTAIICSGDAGIYGMAGLIMELSEHYPGVEIEVVPGITAASSGAALLGAPLTHDFAVISLSDLMTPWETIEKRIRMAAEADFVICLYNPSSKKRRDYLKRACTLVLAAASDQRVCAVARNIGRGGEGCEIMTLGELKEREVDMFTTVFIGNSQTRRIGNYMVTPRGYQIGTLEHV